MGFDDGGGAGAASVVEGGVEEARDARGWGV